MGFSRQEDWNGLPFSSPGDLPDPGIKHRSPAWQADSLLPEPPGKPPDVKRGGCSGTKCKSLELTHAPAQGPRACHKAPRLQEAAQWGKRPQVQATVRCSSRDRAGPQGPQERLPQDGASGSEWSLLGDGEGTWYWRPKESQRAAGPLLGKGAATTGEKAKTPLT